VLVHLEKVFREQFAVEFDADAITDRDCEIARRSAELEV